MKEDVPAVCGFLPDRVLEVPEMIQGSAANIINRVRVIKRKQCGYTQENNCTTNVKIIITLIQIANWNDRLRD